MSHNFNDLSVLSYFFLQEIKCNKSNNILEKIDKEFNEYCFLLFIVQVIEINEQLLSLKILFPLIEELINNNFVNQLKK